MVTIDDIESIIREIIRTDEMIVSNYDSRLLCSDFEQTKNKLKELVDKKKELKTSLESTVNDFFNIKEKKILKFITINSFKLIPSIIGFEYIFSLPRSVNKNSREYYCYISLMERLVREYDSISKIKNEYVILDITATLDLNNLLNDEKNIKIKLKTKK